jgi:MEMO1 family protein
MTRHKPKLRPVSIHPIQHENQQLLLLDDPLHLSESAIAIPPGLATLLMLMDGTRDEAGLEAAMQVRAGLRLPSGLLAHLLDSLDAAYLLDNDRFRQARAAAVDAFRSAPFRPQTVDGVSSEAGPKAATELQAYLDALPPLPSEPQDQEAAPIRGAVCPHIDYQRGGPVYAQVWHAASDAARQAELVIILGTDHRGGEAALTLTRQSYATPFGVLATDQELVDALAAALGEEAVFGEELNHRQEHSIELAAVWLHFLRGGDPVPLLPILCGSFGAFVAGQGEPAAHEPFARAVEVLRPAMAARRTLVVAAADLAHVGPAFGDRHGVDFIGRAQQRNADERLMASICSGDAESFFAQIRDEGDRRHVCGLPPIYLALRLLGDVQGVPAGYDLCPADHQGLSFVSIAGAVLR